MQNCKFYNRSLAESTLKILKDQIENLECLSVCNDDAVIYELMDFRKSFDKLQQAIETMVFVEEYTDEDDRDLEDIDPNIGLSREARKHLFK